MRKGWEGREEEGRSSRSDERRGGKIRIKIKYERKR